MTINTILIKDAKTGKAYRTETVRTAEEICCFIDETENEVRSELEEMEKKEA